MKKSIAWSLVIASVLLFGIHPVISHAQEAQKTVKADAQASPAKDEKWPSFTASHPGLYVNGWPVFTLAYPENWVEQRPEAQGQFFRAAAPGPFQSPSVAVTVFSIQLPLDRSTTLLVPALQKVGKDVKVAYEKPAQLKDGTQAYEAEIEWVHNSGVKLNTLMLATKKEDVWIMITLTDVVGKVGEDLKAVAYSLKVKPGNEEAVKVPDDIRAFLGVWSKAIAEHDMEAAMECYSDKFLMDGKNKQAIEEFIGTVILNITSFDPTITAFEPQGDKVWVTGFIAVNLGKTPFATQMMVKESGRWKWWGNQK